MPTANVNVLAVIVAALATFVLGAVWYSPVLFAKQWMQAHGYTPEQLEAMKRRGVARDRKSTRLNSSHSQISYAVFCLKKKNKIHRNIIVLTPSDCYLVFLIVSLNRQHVRIIHCPADVIHRKL